MRFESITWSQLCGFPYLGDLLPLVTQRSASCQRDLMSRQATPQMSKMSSFSMSCGIVCPVAQEHYFLLLGE